MYLLGFKNILARFKLLEVQTLPRPLAELDTSWSKILVFACMMPTKGQTFARAWYKPYCFFFKLTADCKFSLPTKNPKNI